MKCRQRVSKEGRNAMLTAWAFFWLMSAVMSADPPNAGDFQLELLRGETQTVSLKEATDSELRVAAADTRHVSMKDVVSFRRTSEPADWSVRSSVVWLANGDRIIGEPLTANEDVLSVRWLRYATPDLLALPLEGVTAVCFQTPPSTTGRRQLFRALHREQARQDVAWLESGDRIVGEFAGLTAESGTLQTESGNLPVRREQLAAIHFNPQLITVAEPKSPRYVLLLTDGSWITADRFQWTPQTLSFTTSYGVEAALPAAALLGCRVFSDQVIPLADLKPQAVKFTPYIGGDWPLARNRNVLQGALELRGREFATGMGVHSATTITYNLGPDDLEFRAVVGIDDCALGQGHVVFNVSVDERRIWESPDLTGKSDPVSIPPVDLRGGQQLILSVSFGEQGDVADYADWCDAVLIRER